MSLEAGSAGEGEAGTAGRETAFPIFGQIECMSLCFCFSQIARSFLPQGEDGEENVPQEFRDVEAAMIRGEAEAKRKGFFRVRNGLGKEMAFIATKSFMTCRRRSFMHVFQLCSIKVRCNVCGFKQKKICEVYLSSIASSKAWGREKFPCE